MSLTGVKAEPYDWPYNGALDLKCTAVLCIDWQIDFCGQNGYVDRMGYDISLTRAGIGPTQGVFGVVSTSEQFLAALEDLS